MRRFASALSRHPSAADATGEVCGSLLEQLGGTRPDLLVCFTSPHFAGSFRDTTAALRTVLEPRHLLGATMASVIGDGQEIEDVAGIATFAACLPGATVEPMTVDDTDLHDGLGGALAGLAVADRPATLLLLADPFTSRVDELLQALDRDHPGLQVIGGLASGAARPGANRLAVDHDVLGHGAVGMLLAGTQVRTIVSQGCRPIGRPYVVTRARRNLVEELGGRSPLERLQELAAAAGEEERRLLSEGLHVGIVVDEHRGDFRRGDFLVRMIVGADTESGAIAVGDRIEVGQTIQFHVRDAVAADEDLREMLLGATATGALMFTCTGRGRHLFGAPDHDAALIQQLLGPLPVAGGFCAGEVGPVGGHNFLHGFTASLALFT